MCILLKLPRKRLIGNSPRKTSSDFYPVVFMTRARRRILSEFLWGWCRTAAYEERFLLSTTTL